MCEKTSMSWLLYLKDMHKTLLENVEKFSFVLVYDRNHLFGLGSDTETETENWPKLSADTETNRNQKILNWKALYQGVCKNSLYRHSCRRWS